MPNYMVLLWDKDCVSDCWTEKFPNYSFAWADAVQRGRDARADHVSVYHSSVYIPEKAAAGAASPRSRSRSRSRSFPPLREQENLEGLEAKRQKAKCEPRERL